MHDSVKEGESIVQPLEASGVFPPMVISMIDVGEETGQLPEMLLKIAEVYDDEVDNSVAASDLDARADHDRFSRARRRHNRDRAVHAADQHHQRIAAADVMRRRNCRGVCAKRLTNRFGAWHKRRYNAGFTVIELLIVMAIIIVLAGLILATAGYVQKKGARARAEAEIAAMSAALESYKADNGIYPARSNTKYRY